MAEPTTFTHDGTTFDLARAWVDVTGVEWRWTGHWNAAGEPLLRAHSDGLHCESAVPLPDVYRDHGPLIPVPEPASMRGLLRAWGCWPAAGEQVSS